MSSVAAKIVSVSGHMAEVDVDATSVCPRCAAGKGCGAGLFGGQSAANRINLELPADAEFRPGDTVSLSISSSRLLHASVLVYGLPLAGALLLTFVGGLVIQPLGDAMAIVLAATGLAGGYFAGRRQLRKASCLRQFVPQLSSRADDDAG